MEEMRVSEFPIAKLIPYSRNVRKLSPAAVQKVVKSLRELGFRQPIVADKEVVICGHTRLLAAQQLGMSYVPVHIAENLTPAQVKAYRLMDNRSHEESTWDLELLGPELQELRGFEMDLALTGFDPREIVDMLADPNADERANAVPEVPADPVSREEDLWLCGDSTRQHRVLCGDATSPVAVARVLGDRRPFLMVTDPPYGIELDSEWRERAGLNGCGPAEASYMKHRTEGHHNTSISSDTRADWPEAFALVPSLQVAYVWHASKYTREVLDGLLRIGFVHHQQIIWNKGRTVLTRTHYWFQHEPCWYVRKKNAPWFGKPGQNSTIWDSPFAQVHHGRLGGGVRPVSSAAASVVPLPRNGSCYGLELDPKYVDVVVLRWQQFTGKVATLEDGRSFDEVRAQRHKSSGA